MCRHSSLVSQHEGSKKDHERQQMDRAALYTHPFDTVGDKPRQKGVEPPPRGEEEARRRMIDDASRMQFSCAVKVEDRLEAAAATPRNRPIEVDQQCEVGKRPECAPIAVRCVAARENVKAQG